MKFIKNLFKKSNPLGSGRLVEVDDINYRDRMNLIAEYSIANNVFILVGNQDKMNTYKNKWENINVVGFAKNFTKHLNDLDLSNGVIIDETLSKEMIDYLMLNFDIDIHGGYVRKDDDSLEV